MIDTPLVLLADKDIEDVLQPAIDLLLALRPAKRVTWAKWLIEELVDSSHLSYPEGRKLAMEMHKHLESLTST